MALLSWDPSYSVRISRFDDDHKHLQSLINALHEATCNKRGAEAVQPVLDDLSVYTTSHFEAEESLMERTNFPDLEAHRAEHQEFLRKIDQIQQNVLDKGGQALALTVFLDNWLTHHILKTDKQYSDHLNANGFF